MLEFTKTQTANAARRSMKTSYVIVGSEIPNAQGHITTAVLELTTIHSKERKAFYHSAVRTRNHTDGMFQVGSYDLFEVSPIERMSTPAARYSAKALEAAHAAYLEAIGSRELIPGALEWAAAKEI